MADKGAVMNQPPDVDEAETEPGGTAALSSELTSVLAILTASAVTYAIASGL